MSQRLNNDGCQKGGYLCDCGFAVSRVEKWRRHARQCDLADERPGEAAGASLGIRNLGGNRRGGGGGGGGGAVDTNTSMPDVTPEAQEQGK